MENNEHNQEVVNMGYEEVEEWDRQQWKNEMQRKTIECLTERRFVFSIFFDTYTGVAIIKKNWKGMDAWNEWVDKYRNKYSAIVRGWNDIISVETRYSVYVYRIAFFFFFFFFFFSLTGAITSENEYYWLCTSVSIGSTLSVFSLYS